jgi:rod shape-determining protein MreC
LRAKVAELQNSVLEVGEIERERKALLSLLGARDRVAQVGRRTARVIDAPISNYQRTLELDKGSRDGLVIGMPVETGAGVIGRISAVSVTRSQVELLTDPNFDVGIRMVRSGDDGIASGKGQNRELEVSFIELDTVVIPGETVVTSGFQGSSFPEGLLIGTVVDVVPNAVQGTQRITVHPAADLDRLRWVQVLLFYPDAPEPVVVDRVPDDETPGRSTEEPTQ